MAALTSAPSTPTTTTAIVSTTSISSLNPLLTDGGFRLYNCDPLPEIFRRDFNNGGGIGKLPFRCNILALGGDALNKLTIWDNHQSRCIGELTFPSEVLNVRLRRDRIVVVLEQKIFVYNFNDFKELHQIETITNPKGLCEVSHSQTTDSFILVCPGIQIGQVRVNHYDSKKTKFIPAHDSQIACLTLTQDGQLMATSSCENTLVRIFNTQEGTLLQEIIRSEIYSLAFSPCTQWLAISSDNASVHLFSLKVNDKSDSTPDSPTSSLSFIKDSKRKAIKDISPVKTKKVSSAQASESGSSSSDLTTSFTNSQKAQLRAQILVYGNLIQGAPPDEKCMVLAFGNTDRSFWELSWRAYVERQEESSATIYPWSF